MNTRSSNRKSILFISSVDFKEKSIQVIRKTPEAYLNAGWDVHYVVGRDNSRFGNYSYESELNLEGIKITRFQIPFAKWSDLVSTVVWQAIWFRIRNFAFVTQLVFYGYRKLAKQKFDVVYGYEVPGVLAVRFLRFIGATKQSKLVTRFQGVLYVKEWLREGKKFRFVTNYSTVLALRTKANLCVMTNDGSQGLNVLKTLKSPNSNILFCANGVDHVELSNEILSSVQKNWYPEDGFVNIISVSRLDPHKRIDRGIRIVASLVNEFGFANLRYTIIGGGGEENKLLKLIRDLGMENYVRLIGPINFSEVNYHYRCSDVFISMYTSTNVGNPLLEAIRNNLLIVTLNNGDTNEWIEHFKDGLIYDVNDQFDLTENDYSKIACDILGVLKDANLSENIKSNLRIKEKRKLWTWEDRFKAEISAVEKLLK